MEASCFYSYRGDLNALGQCFLHFNVCTNYPGSYEDAGPYATRLGSAENLHH